MKTQAEEWKEKLLGCKIVDVEMDETHIKSIILEKGKGHLELFPDIKAGINATHIVYEKQGSKICSKLLNLLKLK